jgi:hypothetical protein
VHATDVVRGKDGAVLSAEAEGYVVTDGLARLPRVRATRCAVGRWHGHDTLWGLGRNPGRRQLGNASLQSLDVVAVAGALEVEDLNLTRLLPDLLFQYLNRDHALLLLRIKLYRMAAQAAPALTVGEDVPVYVLAALAKPAARRHGRRLVDVGAN